LFKSGVTPKKSLPKNLSKEQQNLGEWYLLKLSHEEGEVLMEEGREIVMAFSDFTGRLCERILPSPGDRGVSPGYCATGK
jgi:hypothetical protein